MKPQYKRKYIMAQGVNDVLVPPLGAAEIVSNCRYSDKIGWRADMGTENWWNFPNGFSATGVLENYLTNPVDSVYQWKPSNSNTVYTFVEQGGELYYFLGNKNGGFYTIDKIAVDVDRHIRKNSEIGTQYINLGVALLIINGVDKPILFKGDKVWRDFGFIQQTSQPHADDITPGYYDASPKQLSGTAIQYAATSTLGLGTTDNKPSQYSFRISYITDTGSESPLSPIETATWTADGEKFGVTMEIPRGPEGTVARRIYRTKNIPLSGEEFFFEKQVYENASSWYVSYLPDTFLTSLAPSELDSTVIDTSYKWGDVWDGRLWLAKDQQIIYSQPGLFEQFGAADFFDVSNLVGGNITQLISFYNNLIVFRESAINIISKTQNGYQMSTINSSIGTKASNGIISIPNLGILFINDRGIWQMSGGLNGGAQLSIQKISHAIDDTLDLMNHAMIHRTVAAYSMQEEICWWHFADQSNDIPNRGVMLNTIPQQPQWSYFGEPDQDYLTYYPALTTTIDGYFLMGTAPQWFDGAWDEVGAYTYQMGPLQVLSHKGTWAQTATVASIGEEIVYSTKVGPPVGRIWESAWYNFEDTSAKHRVYSVELQILAKGDTSFNFYYGVDYEWNTSNTTNQKQAKPETVFTTKENPVFGPSDTTITKVPFKIGVDYVNDLNLIHIRYDVNTGLVNQFKFGLKSSEPFHLVGYNLLFDTTELPVLNQATRLQRGQSR